RAAARERGRVFGLFADEGVLRGRLKDSGGDRPLLWDPARLVELLQERRSTYAAVDRSVDARGDLESVLDRIQDACARLWLIRASVGEKETRVLVGEDLAEAAVGAIANLAPSRPVLALFDLGVPETIRRSYVAAIRALFPIVEIEVP